MRCLVAALALFAMSSPHLEAQGVMIAPHAVFIDHRTRSAFIQLHNPGTEAAEVTIEHAYGYPVTDSLGFLELRPIELGDSLFPLASWVQAFPRRVVVPPQARQTVRLLARPPEGLPDGEYWARVVITAQAGQVPITGADSTRPGISVGVNLQVKTVIPLIYRKGVVQTGLALSDIRAVPRGDSLMVRARMNRRGSGAWLGTVRGRLIAAAGDTVSAFESALSVYYDLDPRFTLPLSGIPPGRYRLLLEAASTRTDIGPEYTLPAETVRSAVDIAIP